MGLSSGLPLLLTGSTLSLWCSEAGVDIKTVGLLSATALPYTIKFLWAPLVDRLPLPLLTRWLGRRRSWLMFSQMLITFTLFILSTIDPTQQLDILVIVCIILSFAAATQETVMLTYQAERLSIHQYGPSEATGIFGYRLGMILAGAGALYFSSFISWQQTYAVMAMFSFIGIIVTLNCSEPNFQRNTETDRIESDAQNYITHHPYIHRWIAPLLSWLYGAAICPFIDFMKHRGWWLSLLIIFLYKASDNLIGNMSNIFFAHLGFTKIEIANASKIFGMGASILGGFIGGFLINKLGMIRSLFYGCLLHALTIFFLAYLNYVGHDFTILYVTIGLEHLTGGMRLTALFAYQLRLCNPTYAATQLALMASLVSLGRVAFAASAGYCVESLGWSNFFIFSAMLSLPSLLLLVYLAYREQEPLLTSRTIHKIL